MSKSDKSVEWLTSKETEKALRIDACELMHLRLDGRLRFHKKGNAFRYCEADVTKLRGEGLHGAGSAVPE
jgi:hypothetical protein